MRRGQITPLPGDVGTLTQPSPIEGEGVLRQAQDDPYGNSIGNYASSRAVHPGQRRPGRP